MWIESLRLQNFRCFADLQINFDKQLTVLVGINGAGKTSILDAISLYLKEYALYSTNPTQKTVNLPYTDLRKGSSKFTCLFHIYGENDIQHDIQLTYEESKLGSTLFQLEQASIPEKLSQYLNIRESEYFNIVAYYTAKRALQNQERTSPAKTTKKSAYDNAFSTQIDFSASLAWFDEKDAEEARKRSNTDQKEYKNPELLAVREAISLSLGDGETYSFPHMDGVPAELVINHNKTGLTYNVTQLSDGYKTMLALVMDLARRMAVANGDFYRQKSPLESPAVVLIDEVELHLHPSWQQTVLPSLMNIFPNTQFIVTTHSPQVLTSIPAKHIRILEEGKQYTFPEETEGAESSRLLKRIFGVDPRPQARPITQELKEYTDLVYDEKWDTPRAMELQKKLKEHYGEAEAKLYELELHIENSKWEREL